MRNGHRGDEDEGQDQDIEEEDDGFRPIGAGEEANITVDGKSAQEILQAAIDQGREVMCAVPLNIGTTGVFLNADYTFGGGLKVEITGVKVLTLFEMAHAAHQVREAILALEMTDEERKEVMRILASEIN